MSLSSALQWWEEWQLRVLVLASLGVQYFLAILGSRRKSRIRSWYRFFIWLSYLASDALAIYALATLFNRRKKLEPNNGSRRDLEVLWAPILLMHLGGQMFITAYDIEDNELWRRHILTALSQVTVAIYVFCKSWSPSADGRLLAAAVLLFILGILKCFEKPIALKAASFNSLVNSDERAQRAMSMSTSKEQELESFVQQARALFVVAIDQGTDDHYPPSQHTYEETYKQLSVPNINKLFVDFAYPYSDRLANLQRFWALPETDAYQAIQEGLSDIFDVVYTRSKLITEHNLLAGCCCVSTCPLTVALAIIAISLLHSGHKQAYSHNDITVTFVMVYGTLLLDIISYFIIVKYTSNMADDVAQQSLVGFFARNKRHTGLRCFVGCLQCKGLFDQYWCMKPCNRSKEITELVRKYVRDGWTNYIKDAESYRRFNDNMGQWALEHAECSERLGLSLEKPFDEIVLLWHVATDFCIVHTSRNYWSPQGIAISNYMMHLLFSNPEMLMAGSRRNLFTTAYSELEDILKGEENLPLDDKELTEKIFEKVKSKEGCFLHDARLLAEQLIGLGDNKKIWDVITNVWVEMLCFSASRCRGYLHAKSLGSGVEYLSYVWLLLTHAGMETFPERLQRKQQIRLPREEPQDKKNGVASPADSQGLKPLDHKEENHTAPSAPQDECSIVPELEEIVVS